MINKKTLIFIFAFICGNAINANAAIETINPHIGAIQKSFTEPAKTRLENTYEINMPITGKLDRINIKEGSIVKKGEVIAKLEQEPLIQAENQLKSRMETYKALYVLQKKTVARRENLAKKDFIDKQALDEAVAYRNAADSEINATKANLKIAKYNLKESIIRSPINGIVLNRYTQGGKWLNAGAPILRLGNLNELEAICDVLSQEAQMIKIGDPVLLTSIGSSVILHGKVKQIYPAGFTKKSSLGVDEQRVNVIISIKNTETANLEVGYRLQAEFLVGSKEKSALIISRFSVLQDNEGNYYVFKVKNKKLHKQIVKIGIKTDGEISITNGLTTKDKIVAQPTADMTDGMKI